MPPDAIDWYDTHADRLAPTYNAIDPERLHGWLLARLPGAGSAALDVGAGTGRDAAWLAGRGLRVVAVEPSASMRAQATGHPHHEAVTWIDDRLPALHRVRERAERFDLILLSAVWMHVTPAEREPAFITLHGLLRPRGLLAMSLRFGPSGAGGTMHPVSRAEVQALAEGLGARLECAQDAIDQQGRPDVSWTQLAIRRPA